MTIPRLLLRGEDGQMHPIPLLRGPKGDRGDPYVLTQEDIQTIVDRVLEALDGREEVL